jgi:hypothetical protein
MMPAWSYVTKRSRKKGWVCLEKGLYFGFFRVAIKNSVHSLVNLAVYASQDIALGRSSGRSQFNSVKTAT